MSEEVKVETPVIETEESKELPKVEETVKSDDTTQNATTQKAAELDRVARIEKYQREQKQKIEAEKLRIENERKEMSEYKRIKQLKDQDPLKAIEALGLSIDDIIKATQNPKNIDPVAQKALEEVEAIKAELQAEKDRIKREQLAKVEQELTHNIETAIKEGDYDLISGLGLTSSVRQYMEEHYQETGEVLDPREAAKQVNDHIASKIKAVMKSKWLTAEEKKEIIAEMKEQQEEVPTLNNSMTSESPKTKKPMSEKERLAAAMSLLK